MGTQVEHKADTVGKQFVIGPDNTISTTRDATPSTSFDVPCTSFDVPSASFAIPSPHTFSTIPNSISSGTPTTISVTLSTLSATPNTTSECLFKTRCRTPITPEMLRTYPEAPQRKKLGGRPRGKSRILKNKKSIRNVAKRQVGQTKQKKRMQL